MVIMMPSSSSWHNPIPSFWSSRNGDKSSSSSSSVDSFRPVIKLLKSFASSSTLLGVRGNDVDLSIYKGRVLLIVDVASQCGLTNSNYTELAKVYEKYKEQGLAILAFLCNQFGSQKPGTNEEIVEFSCTRFKVEYPRFDKVDVNGDNAAPSITSLMPAKEVCLVTVSSGTLPSFCLIKMDMSRTAMLLQLPFSALKYTS